ERSTRSGSQKRTEKMNVIHQVRMTRGPVRVRSKLQKQQDVESGTRISYSKDKASEQQLLRGNSFHCG
ncbi:uncharacterized, partial [Tachysurus ichikawai]